MENWEKELETLFSLKDIIESYEEIASIRMQKVKESVLENRNFVEGVQNVSSQVRTSYNKELQKIEKKKKSKIIRKTNGKTVTVLLSSNTGLYGDIIGKTFRDFLEFVTNNETDVMIVGKTGYRMYESANTGKEAEYFELSDSFSDKENMERILKHVIEYEKIIIFHGKFKDILVQESSVTDVTEEKAQELVDQARDEIEEIDYIFEPSLEAVMAYFEQEMLASSVKHSVHENSLSKYASRMISLDRATERIHEKISESKLEYQKTRHRIQNAKQQNVLAGIFGRRHNG